MEIYENIKNVAQIQNIRPRVCTIEKDIINGKTENISKTGKGCEGPNKKRDTEENIIRKRRNHKEKCIIGRQCNSPNQ